ncbi:hypothetical protein L1277_001239 [Okibacterium sp. HSC-33S16]|uniref:PIN-like domain-containing protein n=1 Tax=Okibacterium sp. HSC-33S16 TaxID=2910965 RepID=UPI00209EBF5E|nr:PIN-like domain-containing protein [Okibacterium sp. HSC-33S16]MCP2031148.1 hypothetical protein [Okibacterium sp. HSC-33S16]
MEISEAEDRILERMGAATDSVTHHLAALEVAPPASLKEVVAIGLDTNILKLLRKDVSSADQLFLTLEASNVGLIAPGQTITEYWNNFHVFAGGELDSFQGELTRLAKGIESGKLGGYDQGAVRQLQELVEEVSGDLLDSKKPEFFDQSRKLIQSLLDIAICTRVSRTRFADLAAIRMATRTPPGFADEKLKSAAGGDFFVWCDFLLGALRMDPSEGRDHYVWVSDDSKPDWKAGAAGHPVLIEEFRWVRDEDLTILSYSDFRALVKAAESEAQGLLVASAENGIE